MDYSPQTGRTDVMNLASHARSLKELRRGEKEVGRPKKRKNE